MVEMIISIEMIISVGIIALRSGMSGSEIGNAVISEIRRVETNSPTSSSPSCLFPIIRNEKVSRMYIIIVRITIDAKKPPPKTNYYIKSAQQFKKVEIFRKKVLTFEFVYDRIIKLRKKRGAK